MEQDSKDHSPYVLISDQHYTVSWINKSLANKLGGTIKQYLGKPLVDLLYGGDEIFSKEELADKIENKDSFSVKMSFKNNGRQQVEFDVFPINDQSGAIINYMAVGIKQFSKVNSLTSIFFNQNNKHSHLTFEKAKSLFLELERLNEEEKIYLHKSINIEDISKQLQTNKKYVSQLINFFAGESFSTYLNNYRLKEYKDRFIANRSKAIVDWQTVGFGSYSAFYRAVKKKFNCSPSEFKSLLEEIKRSIKSV